MINFLLLLAVPALIAIVVLLFSKGRINLWEFAGMIAAPALLAWALVSMFTYKEMQAKEFWNGQVTNKFHERVSCSHSYECNCYYTEECSGSGSNRSCSEERHCSTCYEHPYDVDWVLQSSTKESVDIARVDRQGVSMPPRWGHAFIGEPFTSEHMYDNYLLLHKDSVLFGGVGDTKKFGALIPPYPSVYDYYHANHFMLLGGSMVDSNVWNWLVNEANKTLGPAKQIDLLFIMVKTDDPNYVQALKTTWLGGQKNDFIVVIGTLDGHKVEFADVISWTPRADLKVDVKNMIEQTSLDNRDYIVSQTVSLITAKFQRLHMKDYKYLLSTVELSPGEMASSMIICILAEIGLVWFFLYIARQNDREQQWRKGARSEASSYWA
jgi:hypothetical protein